MVGLEDVPAAVNRDRVFDFLVDVTEWIDTTSTFFQHVERLPPAHTLTVTDTDQRLGATSTCRSRRRCTSRRRGVRGGHP